MHIRCSKKAYVQRLDCESLNFKAAVNMFERMKTAEYIHEGVVEYSHKKPTKADANHAGHIRQMIGKDII